MAGKKTNAAKKKSAAKTTQKKRSSATATEIEQMQLENTVNGKNQVKSIIFFFLAVFFMCVAVIPSNEVNLWYWIRCIMFGLFGICAYIMPILLGVVAVLGALDKSSQKLTVRLIESAILIWFICAALDIFSGINGSIAFGKHIKYAFAYKNTYGGVLGASLGHLLYTLMGNAGSKITIVILIIVALMFVTGTTLISAYKMLSKPIKSAGTVIENRINEHEKQRASAKMVNLDIPVDGEERPKPKTLDEISEEPLNVEEKRKKVIAAYRGEDYIPDEEIPLPTDEDAIPDDDFVSSVPTPQKGKKMRSSIDIPIDSYIDPETDEKVPAKDLSIPDGPSLDEIPEDAETYRYPPLSLLQEPDKGAAGGIADYEAIGDRLVNVLRSFGIETKIINISVGPTVTRYELQPAAGVKISRITGLADDIAMNLATTGVRIEAPIPNKPAVGIEVPNKNSHAVTIREIIDSKQFTTAKSKLSVALGKDIVGTPIVADISKMPHGLIAGTTGSGKSVCINSMLVSLLYNTTPDEVKLLLIDPKVVELGVYNGIPHLLVPVVTDPRKAAGALGWAVTEMEKRYKLFAENDVRNLEGYNRLAEKDENLIKMPHIVIVIDELADLMMTASNEVEESICRIAQKARAAGMHLLVATQRPSADIITGLIRSNIPSRIAFMVSNATDSRIILDTGGAERLLGKGDMLFSPAGAAKPKRIQGCFVSDEEVESVVEFIKGISTNDYDDEIMQEIERQAAATKDGKNSRGAAADGDGDDDADPMLSAAIECVVENGQASTSLLQRRLKLGYARAARIMDQMADRGIIGPYEGAKPRAVLITKSQLMEMQARNDEIE